MLAAAEGPLLEMSGVTRIFRTSAEVVRALDDVDLDAEPGTFVVIFGASGSGKTTLLRILAGLDDADEGMVRVAGRAVGRLDEERRAEYRREVVGVVSQASDLIEEFTAVENVALPLEAGGVRGDAACAEAEGKLALVGLPGLGHRFPQELSGGQRQRVGIARALVGGRRVLLADEPTAALDSRASLHLFQLLRDLADGGALVVLCSHDPRCRPLAHRVYQMEDGRLRAADGALWDQPAEVS